jgi:hypothetical protein
MIYLETTTNANKCYLICIGDLHFADNAFRAESYKKLKGYIEWVKNTPEAKVVLGGDMFNVAGRNSKTSPFEQRMSVKEEIDEICSLLDPIKDRIVGAIEGNHEHRAKNDYDIDLTAVLCSRLNIPYMGMSGVIAFKVGKINRKKGTKTGGNYRYTYYGYFHHTTGGGGSIGGALNRAEKLANIVEGCDFYCGFHSHKLSHAKMSMFKPNPDAKKVDERTIDFITCGGYLAYEGSYAERGMMRPVKLGSPRIRFSGTKHDVHISI